MTESTLASNPRALIGNRVRFVYGTSVAEIGVVRAFVPKGEDAHIAAHACGLSIDAVGRSATADRLIISSNRVGNKGQVLKPRTRCVPFKPGRFEVLEQDEPSTAK